MENNTPTARDLNENLSSNHLISKHDKCTCMDGRRFNRAKGKWEPCELCERGLKWKVSVEHVPNVDGQTMIERLNIPEYYEKAGDLDLTLLNSLEYCTPDKIMKVQNFMQDISDSIFAGKVKACSFYLYIDTRGKNNIDVKQWVYNRLLDGVNHKLGVVPFISLRELYDLQLLNGCSMEQLMTLESKKLDTITYQYDRVLKYIIEYAKVHKISYQSYITADLVFLEAGPNTVSKYWVALKDLMIERSRLNLPTYVIGYWSLSKTNQDIFFKDTLNSGRLDLLNVVELKQETKTEQQSKNTISIQNRKKYPETRSSITAGVSISEFMGPRD